MSDSYPVSKHTHAPPPAAAPRIGAIILAAGASTRLGRPKQLLPHDGQPLVSRAALAALHAGLAPVIVVLGAHAAAIRPALANLGVIVVENISWPEGLGASIRAGIGALDTHAPALAGVLLALCDQPHFTAASVERLLHAFAAPGITIAATNYEKIPGVPALFSSTHFPALRKLGGAEGARPVIAAHRANTAVVDLPDLACDIDTPADLRFLRPPA